MRRRLALAVLAIASAEASAQGKPDAATAAWWAQTTALANDSMEGRDTGTEAYERAARYVAAQFADAGLKPAGDDGTFFQRVSMHQTDLDLRRSRVTLSADRETSTALTLLQEVTVTPRPGKSYDLDASLIFAGYGTPSAEALPSLKGQIAVVFNNTPADLSAAERTAFAARRLRDLTSAGVLAIVLIDNPGAIEPTHWPAAYARTVQITPVSAPAAETPLVLRISAEAAPRLFAGIPGHPFEEILRCGEKGAPLTTLPLGKSLGIRLATTEKDISSPNILAILPGTDPKLAPEYVALSAHLDGYGYGTPVLGDNLYNGTLDDAAYVALLTELAKSLMGKAPARSLLFCIFTGEEKGLLGSVYFTAYPTVAAANIVADLNLDQLRPIFPLKILTMEGIDDSTIGATARMVAARFGIELRPDRETERNLFRRADNYSFVRIGVPIGSFIFGYNPGSPEEVIYRDWYARRYHKPQDDLATSIDWAAAGTFNRFYADLVVTLSNAPARPAWLSFSPYAPKPASGR